MDSVELRDIGKYVAESLADEPRLQRLVFQVSRVMSYLASEQEKRQALEKMIAEHAKLMENFVRDGWEIGKLKEQSAKNGKLLLSVLGSILGVAALELCKLVFGKH